MQLASQDVDGLPFDVQDDYVDVLLALDPLADLELVDIQLTQVTAMTLRLPLEVSKQQVPLPLIRVIGSHSAQNLHLSWAWRAIFC